MNVASFKICTYSLCISYLIAKTLEMLVLILINIIIAVLYTLTFTNSQHKKKIEKEQLGTMQTGYAGSM